MKQVLLITNEPNRPDLEALANLGVGEWAVVVCSGEAARSALTAARFDAVVSDLPPDSDGGARLLREVRERTPGTVRILLLEDFDRGSAAFALANAHRFLTKPCGPNLLRRTIERCLALASLLEDRALAQLSAGTTSLPPAPEVFLDLQRAIESPEPDLDEIAEIVEREPAMATRVLQIVNSAIYGLSRPLVDIAEAVRHLGLLKIRNIVLDTALQDAFPGELAGGLQMHGFLCSLLAAELLDDPVDRELARCAGLVHDVGKLVLASRRDDYQELLALADAGERPLHEWEADALGGTHAEVGAFVLGLWGLPTPIVEAVAYHHRPTAAPGELFDVVGAVHVANALIQERDDDALLDAAYLERLASSSGCRLGARPHSRRSAR